jgi:hypothetical protein
VLDLLLDQAARDGGEGFHCRGRVKIELLGLENALRARDRAAARGEAMPEIVALAAVMQGDTLARLAQDARAAGSTA